MPGVGGWGGDFSFVHSCARIAEICVVLNAVRPMTQTGGDEKNAGRRGRVRSTSGLVSGFSVPPVDPGISG
jgi:hypothetical protein